MQDNHCRQNSVDDENFYVDGKKYWTEVPATVDGMLGGFASVSNADIAASRRFLLPFITGKKARTGHRHALDCGAGIGRITKYFLSTVFDKVDLLEQNAGFLDEARNYLCGESGLKIDRYICSGLQDFVPEPDKYDVIWVQWVLSHIPENGVLQFLERTKSGLSKHGLLIIKENVCSGSEEERDEHDFTITRPAKLIRSMVRRVGYVVTKEQKQNNFPAGLYEVRMFACRLSRNNE